MLKVPIQDTIHTSNKQVQFLENKLNKLGWLNDDLHKQVFDAVQRGHRLAAKLGYKDLDEAERALATQLRQGSEERHSQLEQLSQYPSLELAEHIQSLQSELVSHVRLSKSTLEALGDALAEIAALREEKGRLGEELDKVRGEEAARKKTAADMEELAFTRAELAALKTKYEDLRTVKEAAEKKYAEDYLTWKEFKKFFDKQERRRAEGRASKRRKPNPEGDNDGYEEEEERKDHTPKKGDHRRKSDDKSSSRSPRKGVTTPMRAISPCPTVLTSKSLNSSPLNTPDTTPSKLSNQKMPQHKVIKRESIVKIPEVDEDLPASSETEPDSQPVAFLYPSQQNVPNAPSANIKKRPHSPVLDSSETENESQATTFLLPSQIIPPLAQVMDMTPKPRPTAVQRGGQLHTPVSLPRPQLQAKGKERAKLNAMPMGPPSSPPPRPYLFREPLPPATVPKARLLPATPLSCPPKKGEGRAAENDENAPASTSASAANKKFPSDYSIYKGRGRYGAEVQAGKETINALYEIDLEHNQGVAFQYEEVVRDKNKRRQMHAVDCECCRDYYRAIGTLPARPQPPKWRSPDSSPSSKRSRDSFENDENENTAAIEQHRQVISRHREHWARAETPPGYWNIGFPDTQQVEEMNAEARRMHERKRALVAVEAQRSGKFKRR